MENGSYGRKVKITCFSISVVHRVDVQQRPATSWNVTLTLAGTSTRFYPRLSSHRFVQGHPKRRVFCLVLAKGRAVAVWCHLIGLQNETESAQNETKNAQDENSCDRVHRLSCQSEANLAKVVSWPPNVLTQRHRGRPDGDAVNTGTGVPHHKAYRMDGDVGFRVGDDRGGSPGAVISFYHCYIRSTYMLFLAYCCVFYVLQNFENCCCSERQFRFRHVMLSIEIILGCIGNSAGRT